MTTFDNIEIGNLDINNPYKDLKGRGLPITTSIDIFNKEYDKSCKQTDRGIMNN
jgi:hypothetical protein